MPNLCNYCVYDFETGGKDPKTCEPIQIAAIMINGRTLEVIPDSAFNSYMQPTDFDNLEEEALNINKITREELRAAPLQEHVWERFVAYVNKYRISGWPNKPIPCGYNIDTYDAVIIDRLCEKYGQYKKNKQDIFSIESYDVIDEVRTWFENSRELENMRLSTVLNYFGIDSSGAHNALFDVVATGLLASRFLNLKRTLFNNIKWKEWKAPDVNDLVVRYKEGLKKQCITSNQQQVISNPAQKSIPTKPSTA